MGDVEANGKGFTIAWGRSVLEPTRGHVRETHNGQPVTNDVNGAVVGMALCGALLIDDLAPEIAAGEFDRCSVCLDLLEEIRRSDNEPVMTVPIAPDLGAWLVLRRVQWDRVTLDVGSGTLFDHGKRLPPYLTPHVHQLVDHGYVRLNDQIPDTLCRRVTITDAGERLLDLLYDLRRRWLARQGAGLQRCPADLDTLVRVLDRLHRPPVSPGHK